MSGENGGGNCRGVDPNPVPRIESIDESLLISPQLLFIGSKIGEGAHGKVYQGRYRDRIVAIKVLNCGSTVDERAVLESRFIREVNMMSRVKHENLVKAVHWGMQGSFNGYSYRIITRTVVEEVFKQSSTEEIRNGCGVKLCPRHCQSHGLSAWKWNYTQRSKTWYYRDSLSLNF